MTFPTSGVYRMSPRRPAHIGQRSGCRSDVNQFPAWRLLIYHQPTLPPQSGHRILNAIQQKANRPIAARPVENSGLRSLHTRSLKDRNAKPHTAVVARNSMSNTRTFHRCPVCSSQSDIWLPVLLAVARQRLPQCIREGSEICPNLVSCAA